jgi:streptogramin lyase
MNTLRRPTHRWLLNFCLITVTSLFWANPASAQIVDDVSEEYSKIFRGQVTANDMVQDNSRNTYFVGSFAHFANLDDDVEAATLTNNGNISGYLSKFDPDGSFLWAVQMDQLEPENDNLGSGVRPFSLDFDPDGNIYITGSYDGTVDFDPGEGTAIFTASGPHFTDVYIQKLDSEGNFIWAVTLNGTQFTLPGHVVVDEFGDVFTSGSFHGTVDFDPGEGVFELTNEGFNDAYQLKLDTDGNFVWAISKTQYLFEDASGMAKDSSGNFYITRNTQSESYVMKIDTDGNTVWAKAIDGHPDFRSIAVDSSGNVFTTGGFTGTVDFDPGEGTAHRSASDNSDIFIHKLDGDGNFVWVRTMNLSDFGIVGHGVLISKSHEITVDFAGDAYIVGSYGAEIWYFTGVPYTGVTYGFASKWNADGDNPWTKIIRAYYVDHGNDIAVDASANVYTLSSSGGGLHFEPTPEHNHNNAISAKFFKFSSGRVGSVTSNLAALDFIEGSRLELTAEVDAVGHHWLKNGEPMADGGTVSGVKTKTLVIDPLATTDTGVYSCFYNDGTTRGLHRTDGFSVTVGGTGSGGTGTCLIAAMAHGTPFAKELDAVRAFRNEALLTNPLGTAFANIYYQVSPVAVRLTSSLRELQSRNRIDLKTVIMFGLLMAACMAVGLEMTRRKQP